MRTSRFLFGCGLLLLAASAQAQNPDIIVSKTEDSFDGVCDSDCSLREAITLASQRQGSQRIRLGAGVYRIELAPLPDWYDFPTDDEDANHDGDLDVRSAQITLIGAGNTRTFIDAGQLDRHFDIAADAELLLQDLALQHGLQMAEGGSIRNRGTLELKRVRLLNNQVIHSYVEDKGRGGAIVNYGEARILRSELILSQARPAHPNDDYVRGQGGAVFNQGSLLVRDSAFRGGFASGNTWSSGGALYNRGSADIARSAFIGNGSLGPGAAIDNAAGEMVIANTTFSGNIVNWAIANDARLSLVHVTLADNQLGLRTSGPLHVRNSLVMGNAELNCVREGNAVFDARGLWVGSQLRGQPCPANNVVDNATVFGRILQHIDTNSPGLPIHPLTPGGPAVDASSTACASHDQRGVARPRDGLGHGLMRCDLGAYEL